MTPVTSTAAGIRDDRTEPWYADHGEIAALIRWLDHRGDLGGVDEAINVCEKPWHYTVEYDAMVAEERAL